METNRCKYVFLRAPRLGEQCDNKSETNGFCSLCWIKPNAKIQLEQGYIEPWNFPEPKQTQYFDAMTDRFYSHPVKMAKCGTFSHLCRKISSAELLSETQKFCEESNTEDKSYDIAATAKYIAQLPPRDHEDFLIVVPNRKTVGCQCSMFPVYLHQITNWNLTVDFPVIKDENVTEVEAVRVILWALTCKEFPDEYYTWLGVNKDNMTKEEFNNAVKQKLGL